GGNSECFWKYCV
nr:urotensin II [Oncorhynchus mykiss]